MRKLVGPSLLLLLVIIIFRSWFFPRLLSTFDFPYYSSLMMKDASVIPYAWGWHVGLDGFARFISPYSWIMPFINIPQVVFGRLGVDWAFIERVVYLSPLLALMVFSPILLFKQVIPNNKFYLLSIIIFSFNTYSLLLAAGQVFFALAFMLAPIILALSIYMLTGNLTIYKRWIFSIITGLVLTIQVMVDPRITFVTMSAVTLYLVFIIMHHVLSIKSSRKKILYTLHLILYTLAIPLGITVLLHAFWIIPSFLHGGNPVEALGSSYSTVEAVKYLSFAKLENTISLLHPNWPENIFGKVYFMRPEFLGLPLLAFGSLFFINGLKSSRDKINLLFFGLLGIFGAFLAKGSNEPFGGAYLWLFKYFTGFVMFRDPAKWYLLIAISYSVLIPFTVWKIYEFIKLKTENLKLKILRNFLPNLFLTFIILYFMFLIRPAILGQLGGMFKTTSVPGDYVTLEKYLYDQPNYSRTLWVPSKQRFGFYSNTHPEISAQVLFNEYNNDKLLEELSKRETESLLQQASIKYIIVPYDLEGEIFLKDRKYDEKEYQNTINAISKITWLKEIKGFGKIKIFELSGFKNHFYIKTSNLKFKTENIEYKYVSPVEYRVNLKNVKKGDILVFSESYDGGWVSTSSKFKVLSSKFNKRFNSFVLPQDGSYSLEIYYTLQDYVNIGIVISGLTLVLVIGTMLYLKKRE